MRPSIRVLAIDPGFGRAGIAVLERKSGVDQLLHSECVVTDAGEPFQKRLGEVCEAVQELVTSSKPDLMALERLYFTNNQKTAMQVAEVRGALLALAAKENLPVVEYTPLEVKIAVTGFGRSGKREVAHMVPILISLPSKKGRLDDEYDAIAIGLTALASYRPA